MKKNKIIYPIIMMTTTLMFSNLAIADAGMEKLAMNSGCVTCHSISHDKENKELPIGPSFYDIATRFHSNEHYVTYEELVRTIKYGSSPYRSHWKGKITGLAMPPNGETMSDINMNKLLIWILSLNDKQS
jgi:cytochrome c